MTTPPTAAARLAALDPQERAALLRRLRTRSAPTAPEAGPVPRVPTHPDVQPVSFEQRRLWFLDRFQPGSTAHVIPLVLALDGELDLDRLQGALDGLVRRHEALRTTFVDDDDTPRQLVGRPGPVALALTDLREHDPAEADLMARTIVESEVRRPFDLVVGPLFRALLVRLSELRSVLVLTLHHAVADGWSLGRVTADLADLYAGRTPSPEVVPVQYADYAVWQQERFAGDRLERAVEVWREQLGGTPALDLPTDRPRPPVRRGHGAWAVETIPATLADGIHSYAAQRNTTPFAVLLAALEVTLGRLADQDDFAIGTVLAGRDRIELEPMVGYVARTVAVRSDLPGADRRFSALVDRIATRMTHVQEHGQLPFERLIDALDVPRDPSRTPIFSTFVVLQNTPPSGADLPGLTVRAREADTRAAQFDLSLYLTGTAAGYEVGIELDTDLFDEATARRVVAHLRTVLTAALADPDRDVDTLPLLDDTDLRTQLRDWNATDTPLPHASVLAAVDRQVRHAPDAVAVEDTHGTSLTYAELDARSRRVATWLAGHDVGPGALVGVAMRRGADLVAALLGVWRRGAAYVPLDPAYPAARLAQMVEDSGMPVAVTDGASAAVLALDGLPTLVMDRPGALPDKGTAGDPWPAELPAYCIFTSGSTGRPKGVVVGHQALLNLLTSVVERCGLGPETRLVAVTSLSFDIAGLEVWAPLVSGGCVVVCDEARTSDAAALGALLDDARATAMQATPATWRMLVDAGWPGRRLEALCGGEALPQDLADRLRPLVGRLWNMYGPTETTIWSGADTVVPGEVVIGNPLSNTRLYVLDGRGRPSPLGVPGELHIAGAGLAHGYLGRPAMTAERFVPDPFADQPGSRMYRTGDLVRQRRDGRLRFVARLDNQVKVRGHRIELGDVESALDQAPGVLQAVVTVSVTSDVPQLVAHVRPVPGEAPSVASLRAHLGRCLPAYMVPSRFAVVDVFPLTPNGKVDRTALPDVDAHAMATGTSFEAPRGDTEQRLAAVWAELLGRDRVGRRDSFFALGGDSLLAVRMVSRAGLEGIQLTTQQVFQHQTLADLAGAAGTVQLVAEQGEVTGEMPLPIATHQFQDGVNPMARYHSIAFQFETRERVDADVLDGALNELLAHHDALRTRALPGPDGGWRALVIDPYRRARVVEEVDVSETPDDEVDAVVDAWTTTVETGFVPEDGSLFRAVLLDLGTARPQRLLLAGHYLVADVISWHILIGDLDILYRRRSGAEPYRLPAKTTSMPEWMGRVAEGAQRGEADGEVALWTDEARTTAYPITVDRPDGDNTVGSNASAFLILPVDDTSDLLERAVTRAKLPLDAVLLSALGRAVTGGGPVLSVDIYVPGRDSPYPDMDLSRTVGWLTYRYPMWLDLHPEAGPVEAVRAVARQLSAVPRGGLGAGQLRYVGRDEAVATQLREQPVPDVLFNFFGAAPGGFQVLKPLAGTSGHYHDTRSERMRPLMVNGAVFHGQLRLEWEYSADRHDAQTIEAFIDGTRTHLLDLIDACGAPASVTTTKDGR